jgi:hypothetical protein
MVYLDLISFYSQQQDTIVQQNIPAEKSDTTNGVDSDDAKPQIVSQSKNDSIVPKQIADTALSDTARKVTNYSPQEAEQIILQAREKEKELKQKEQLKKLFQQKKKEIPEYDQDTIPYVKAIEQTDKAPEAIFYEELIQHESREKQEQGDISEVFIEQEQVEAAEETEEIVEKPVNNIPQDNEGVDYSNDWILGIFLLSFVMFIGTKLFYNKYIKSIRKASYNSGISERLLTDQNILLTRASFFLNFIFIINAGLFVYESLKYFQAGLKSQWHPIYWMLIFTGIVLIYYLGKYVILKIFAFVFNQHKLINVYIHNIFVYNKNIGLFLFPVIIAIPYVPDFMQGYMVGIGLLIIIWFTIWRIFRGLQIVFRFNIPFLYLILYLCTIEILPILIIYRLITDI